MAPSDQVEYQASTVRALVANTSPDAAPIERLVAFTGRAA
jgi:hypothetical protein